MGKKIIVLIFTLFIFNLSYSNTIDDINGIITEAFDMYVVKPQSIVKSVANPEFQKNILGSTYDKIIEASEKIGTSMVVIFMLIAITMKAAEIEKFQWEHVTTCAIKAGIASVFILKTDLIYGFFNELANEFIKGIEINMSYSKGFVLDRSLESWIGLILGFIIIIVIIFTGIVFLLFVTEFVIRVVKMLIFQILAPIFISFSAWDGTVDLTKNFIVRYFTVSLEIVFIYLVLNIAISMPQRLERIITPAVGAASAYGIDKLIILISYSLILYSLNRFSDKITSYITAN